MVENKIPSVSSLVKKTDYSTKITQIEKKLTDHNCVKYITTLEFNTLAARVFNARLAQANLITKTDFDAKLSNLNRKITSNKTKLLLVENEFKKLKTFDSSYFRDKNYVGEDVMQNYLVFEPLAKYFIVITNTEYISAWKSKGLSNKSITPPTTSDHRLNLQVDYYGTKIRVKFNGSCFKQDKSTDTHKNVASIYILYELSSSHSDDPTPKNCLFGAVRLTKYADIGKYQYSSYGIVFDRKSSFSFLGGGFGQNVIIFGVDMSSSVHVDDKKRTF